jgi:hypothetical protein
MTHRERVSKSVMHAAWMSARRRGRAQQQTWSEAFGRPVADVDGADVPGRRALLNIDGGCLVDVPLGWVSKQAPRSGSGSPMYILHGGWYNRSHLWQLHGLP